MLHIGLAKSLLSRKTSLRHHCWRRARPALDKHMGEVGSRVLARGWRGRGCCLGKREFCFGVTVHAVKGALLSSVCEELEQKQVVDTGCCKARTKLDRHKGLSSADKFSKHKHHERCLFALLGRTCGFLRVAAAAMLTTTATSVAVWLLPPSQLAVTCENTNSQFASAVMLRWMCCR